MTDEPDDVLSGYLPKLEAIDAVRAAALAAEMAALAAELVALDARFHTPQTWESKADDWTEALDAIDERLTRLAHRIGTDVPPHRWSKDQREAVVTAIAAELEPDDGAALRRAFGLST